MTYPPDKTQNSVNCVQSTHPAAWPPVAVHATVWTDAAFYLQTLRHPLRGTAIRPYGIGNELFAFHKHPARAATRVIHTHAPGFEHIDQCAHARARGIKLAAAFVFGTGTLTEPDWLQARRRLRASGTTLQLASA